MSNDDTTPQNPGTTPDPASEQPAPAGSDEQLTPAPAPSAAEAPAPQRRTGVLVAGVAVAVILSAGVGAAFALAVSGGDDDVTGFTTSGQGDADDADDDGPDDGGPTAADAQTDLDGMLAAVDQAATAAEGQVVAIEERSPGTWRVEVQGAGRDVEVVVDGSGARVVEEDDDDDGGDELPLTAESVTALVAAATTDTAGRVVQIESDDDGYSVEVRTATGSTVEIDLDQAFQVAGRDDDDSDDD